MEYRKRNRFCFLLAALCLLSALPRLESLAKAAPDTGAPCTLSVKVALNEPAGDWEELKEEEIRVRICRVASLSGTGEYVAEKELEGREEWKDFYRELEGLKEDPGKADAAFWLEQAGRAAELYGALCGEDGAPPAGLAADTIVVKEGEGRSGKLPAGLYLVYPEEVRTALYSYAFVPYLVQLPVPEGGRWRYEAEAGLKPERTAGRGDLLIEKTLLRHNASLGPAVFVFQVDAFRDLDGDGAAENVYSDVVSLSFDKAGTRQALVKGLPAGAEVTVREVYSGSAYEAAPGSEKEQTATVLPAGEGAEDPAKVTFVNDYNDSLRPGTGITNRFTWEEGWRWEKITHSLSGDTVEKGGDGDGQNQP